MKRQNFLHLLTIMMVAMLSVGFTSCSNDDDDGKNNGLVGSWTCSNHYIDWIDPDDGAAPDTYTFKSNGTYEWKCRGWDDESGKYNYNEKLGTLTIVNQRGTTWVYIIPTLTDSYFVMIDEDGDSYTYYRR